MDMTIQFTTQEAANAAVTVLSSALGIPKYGLKGDGTPNTDVIIDRYANPEEVDGKWQIPVTNEAQLLIDGGVLSDMDFEIEEPTNEPTYKNSTSAHPKKETPSMQQKQNLQK